MSHHELVVPRPTEISARDSAKSRANGSEARQKLDSSWPDKKRSRERRNYRSTTGDNKPRSIS